MKNLVMLALALSVSFVIAGCNPGAIPNQPASQNQSTPGTQNSNAKTLNVNDVSPQSTAATRHRIRGVQSNRCLDIPNGTTEQEARLQIFDCTPENLQQFLDITLESNGYKMKFAHSGLCLEVAENGTINEKPLQQRSCDDSDTNQRWKVEPIAGSFRIRNVHSNLCMDIMHESVGNMSAVAQHECLDGQANQRFIFEPALPPPPTPPTPPVPPIEKKQICFTQPVPENFILINRFQGHLEGCDDNHRFNVFEIQRGDNRPAGEILEACHRDVIPGWELVEKFRDPERCGPANGVAPNMMRIRKK